MSETNVKKMNNAVAQVSEQDCAVCLQKCNYPTQLPCGHIFCFLCVKGVAIQSKKCALCRTEIPPDYLDHPVVLEEQSNTNNSAEEYQWYYEGRNGWWKYDDRSNSDLEAAFNAGDTTCKLLLAGAVYCINFQNMVQVQSRDQTRRRRVRRDTPMLPAKGIAGIKMMNKRIDQTKIEEINNQARNTENEIIEIADDNHDDDVIIQQNDDIESPYNNSGVNELVHRLSTIDLREEIVVEIDSSQNVSAVEET